MKIALGLLGALSGCAEEGIPIPQVSWEGEHLVFGSDLPTETLCGGTLRYMDDYVGTLQEALQDQSNEKVHYYHLVDPLHLYENGCPESALGWEQDRRILSYTVPHEHELVHAVFEVGDPAHPLIGEGIAVYWGGKEENRLRPDLDLVEVAKRLSVNKRSGDDYPLVGHFMAYLMREFGIEAVREIARRTLWPRWKYDHLQQVFRDVVGKDLEALAQDYEENFPKCEWEDFHEPIHACRKADYEVCGESSRVIIEVDLECGADTAVGVEDGNMWMEFAVDFAKDGNYFLFMLDSQPMEEGYVFFRPCDDACGSQASRTYHEWDWEEPMPYKAGRYVVRFIRPADQPSTMSFQIRGEDCG